MPLTFGLTGMDPAMESSLRAAFTEANARLGGRWEILPETQAQFVVVDMDSMYGPMSWLRLHAAGKTVIGLTLAPRTQTDFRLTQPFTVDSVAQLLIELADKAGEPLPAAADAGAVAPPVAPAGLTPAPQPQDLLPEEQPLPADEEEAPPSEPLAAIASHELPLAQDSREPPSAAAGQIIPPAPSIQPHLPAATAAPMAPTPPAPPPEPARDPDTLLEWLASGRLKGRVRLQRDGTPLLIDLDKRQYFGPAVLKPLTTHVKDAIAFADFEPVSDADWNKQTAALDAGQPLVRLVWFANLIAGQGKLVPGVDPQGRFQMTKWPQTEREYPKHFRIATVMMKGPATLAEIADGSGVPLPDVTDFVNANLASGFAEIERAPEPEPEPTKSSGLFGRLRGR